MKVCNIDDTAPSFVDRCLSIDLEVNPESSKIFAFAAVRSRDLEKVVFRDRDRDAALDRLENMASEAEFLLGHNILRHDLPHLTAARPSFGQLSSSPVDTLWLNPLAFPRNPYHHLVKHHHDGRLQAGHVNDPELNARLVLQVLANQIEAFRRVADRAPAAIEAYHYLATCAPDIGGFDAFFADLRRATRPAPVAVEQTILQLLND